MVRFDLGIPFLDNNMCTIGAMALGQNEYLLFKTKDFARPRFEDRVEVKRDWFGPLGLETFADDPAIPNVFSGLSIGANRNGLLCCVNHVKTTGDASLNYDLLTQAALAEAENVLSAIEVIESHTKQQPYWWGNVILADGRHLAAVEVRGNHIRSESSTDRIFRVNHQPLFGESRSPDGINCSANRFASASRRMPQVSSLEGILEMLTTHDDGETGICNHGHEYKTVYAYVLHHKSGNTALYVAHGNPCQSDWIRLTVPIGHNWSSAAADEFVKQYPGAVAA